MREIHAVTDSHFAPIAKPQLVAQKLGRTTVSLQLNSLGCRLLYAWRAV